MHYLRFVYSEDGIVTTGSKATPFSTLNSSDGGLSAQEGQSGRTNTMHNGVT